MGLTGIDGKCELCISMQGGECTSLSNSFEL